LIVVPLILLETRTWEKEMERFFAGVGSVFSPVETLHGSNLAKFRRDDAEGPELDIGKPILNLARLQLYRVLITNYETVKNYQHSFAHFKDGKPLWSVIVSDEAQEYKTPSSKISHAMKALKGDFQIACTGTPVENRLLDLWNVCDTIQPGLLSSAKEFKERYESKANAATSDGNLEELKRTLLFQRPHAFLLRRNKSDVADLPVKQVVKIPCDMSQTEIELHHTLLKELRRDGQSSNVLAVLQRFAALSQHPALLTIDGEDASAAELISGSSKLTAVIQRLHVIRAKREKAIIFARHIAMQRILAKALESEFQMPANIINGETKTKASSLRSQGAKTRNAILQEFKAKQGFNLIILSPFVAGVGLTITEANHVFHYGRWWNPAVESQATDRAYRIGQTKDVFVYIPMLHDPSGRVTVTFDERLDVLMERRYRLAEEFLKPLPPEEQIGNELLDEMQAADS
jgi:SNF2 family DNA or RNA helicase